MNDRGFLLPLSYIFRVDTMPCTTLTINETEALPPPEEDDDAIFILFAGAALIYLLLMKK